MWCFGVWALIFERHTVCKMELAVSFGSTQETIPLASTATSLFTEHEQPLMSSPHLIQVLKRYKAENRRQMSWLTQKYLGGQNQRISLVSLLIFGLLLFTDIGQFMSWMICFWRKGLILMLPLLIVLMLFVQPSLSER